jgi:hypothetical protein
MTLRARDRADDWQSFRLGDFPAIFKDAALIEPAST